MNSAKINVTAAIHSQSILFMLLNYQPTKVDRHIGTKYYYDKRSKQEMLMSWLLLNDNLFGVTTVSMVTIY